MGLVLFASGNQAMCGSGAFHPGPDEARTRTFATEFTDAYNARDMPRLLTVFTKSVTYTDRAHCTRATIHGKPALKRWLQQRFKEGDSLNPSGDIAAQPGRPNVATLQVTRSSSWWTRRGVTAVTGQVRLVMGGPGDARIASVVFQHASDACTTASPSG